MRATVVEFHGFSDEGVFFTITGQLAQELAVLLGDTKGYEPRPGFEAQVDVILHPLQNPDLTGETRNEKIERLQADLFTTELPNAD